MYLFHGYIIICLYRTIRSRYTSVSGFRYILQKYKWCIWQMLFIYPRELSNYIWLLLPFSKYLVIQQPSWYLPHLFRPSPPRFCDGGQTKSGNVILITRRARDHATCARDSSIRRQLLSPREPPPEIHNMKTDIFRESLFKHDSARGSILTSPVRYPVAKINTYVWFLIYSWTFISPAKIFALIIPEVVKLWDQRLNI